MRVVSRAAMRSVALAAVLSVAIPLGGATAAGDGSHPATPVSTAVSTAATSVSTIAVGTSVTFTGHGWGHGRGMGQYGALGYAVDHGWSHSQILDHFYSNTTAGNVGNPEMTVELLALTGSPLVVSATQIRVTDGAGGVLADLGTGARFTLQPDGTVKVERGTGCVSDWQVVAGTFVGNNLRVTTTAPDSSIDNLLRVCDATGERAYRGSLSVVNHNGSQMTINHLPTESYLRGVVPRESPAAWGNAGGGRGMNALRAQAVAARSYALASTRPTGAKTCDTTTCQVYLGAGYKTSSWDVLEATNTDVAIAETAGQVRLRGSVVARTEFSSSTGGYTAGGDFPAVIDAGDAISANPNHTWTATFSSAAIAAKLGISGLQSITVTQRDGNGDWGGRVKKVVVVDGAGGSHPYDGDQFRTLMGTSTFKSDWFTFGSNIEAQNVVRALYADVLGRAVDPDGLNTWTAYIERTGDPAGLVQLIATSRERMEKLVTAQYVLALNRTPEPSGLDHWVAHLAANRGVYDLQVGIYGSPESLIKLGGGDVNTWVGALYERILGRASAPSERAFWTDIAARQGREAVVAAIARSDEATMRRLEVYYQTFLLRGVDPAGRATFLPLMTGRGDFTIPVALGSSPEYWARAQTRSFG